MFLPMFTAYPDLLFPMARLDSYRDNGKKVSFAAGRIPPQPCSVFLDPGARDHSHVDREHCYNSLLGRDLVRHLTRTNTYWLD